MLIAALAVVATVAGPPPVKFVTPTATPPVEAIRAAYPATAIARRVGGGAMVDCYITPAGIAEDCKTLSEWPKDVGFGPAALKLVGRFAFAPTSALSDPVAARLRFPVLFDWPKEAPGWVPPNWDRRPTAEDLHAVWPSGAMTAGIGGVARLHCQINTHGVPENCAVIAEEPAGYGFGAAALLLTPGFLFTPGRVGAAPVVSSVVVPINFKAAPGGVGAAPISETVTMINRAEWTAAPTFAEAGAAYPRDGGGGAGYVALRCGVKPDGLLHGCDVVREEPTGKGFARAAQSLVPRFRAFVDPHAAALHRPMQINLPIRLIDPASTDFAARAVGEPTWTRVLDPVHAQALYPSEAAAKGVKTGVGVARCTVAADGSLIDCAPKPDDPDGLGFSEAAVAVVSVMKMNLWTQEGGPIDGATVTIPIRFKLADDAK